MGECVSNLLFLRCEVCSLLNYPRISNSWRSSGDCICVYNYLQGRLIYMATPTANTTLHRVTRGVPQGGVLSTTLFNVTLIWLPNGLKKITHISIYTDDICGWISSVSQRNVSPRSSKAGGLVFRNLADRGLKI